MATPTCSTGCNPILAATDFDDCAPQVNASEIKRLFIGSPAGAPLSDWRLAGPWNARVSQTNTSPNAIRALTVIGDVPAATDRTKEISNNRVHITGRDRTLNATIDDTSDANYEFCRQLQCGGKYRVWWETHGGKMYGGNSGVLMTLNASPVNGRGKDEVEVFNITGTWTAKFSPERVDSPIFVDDNGIVSTFNSNIAFTASATPAAVAGVTAVAQATDAELLLEFNAISPLVGTNLTMLIKVSGVTRLTVTFSSDYLGAPLRFTDIDGTVHQQGIFTQGTVNY